MEQTREEIIEQVRQAIKKYGLDNPTRQQTYLYQRYFLYHILHHKVRMTKVDIGKMFNKDHSSVIHGLNTHDILTDINDITYKLRVSHLMDEFGSTTPLRDLKQDVMHCYKMSKLDVIKNKIKMGYYDL